MPKLGELIRLLAVVDENIVSEAIRQPSLFIDAARYRVSKMREVSRAKAELDSCMSSIGLRIRAKGAGGDQRTTEGYVKSKILRSPTYNKLQSAVHDAERKEEFSKLLLEAYRMRRDAIRIIADEKNYESGRQGAEVERMQQRRKLVNKASELHRRRMSQDE
jgi:hypothetical protein